MQAAYGGNATDRYLAQRIAGASPERLAALLLEGAQRFLAQAISAMQRRDVSAKARFVNRVSAIVEELTVQLNFEVGGELVTNLTRLYEWWLNEIFEGSQRNQVERLECVGRQMSEMRATWEEFSQHKKTQAQPSAPISSDGLVG